MTLALVVLGGFAIAAGGWLCVTAFATSTPSLARTVAHLHRPPVRRVAVTDRWTAFGSRALMAVGGRAGGEATRRRLDLVVRTPDADAALLATAALT